MKRQIRVLPPEVIGQISAGEVVERPASVIKELLENALDADSTELRVLAAEGGVSLIEVSDNGVGMDPAGALEACKRYATSKIRGFQDLLRLRTLGFRGEALFSIASVSHVTIVTRGQTDQEGTRILVEGGQTVEASAWGSPPGTMVRVEELFYNVPARRKFLRSTRTEASHLKVALERLAMANYRVGFHYEYEGRQVLECPAATAWTERIRQLWGKDICENLYPVYDAREDLSVDGFLSHPNFKRSTASWIWIYVNDRAVQDRGLLHALMRGFGPLLERGKYPVGVLRVTLDPKDVDVNVHPTKREVRFRDPERVQGSVVTAVRRFLRKQSWVPDVLGAGEIKAPAEEEPLSIGTRVAERAPALAFPFRDHAVSLETDEATLQDIRFLGQVGATYLIFSGPERLLIVDQHAAHERILFEQLRAQLGSESRVKGQTLLWDEIVELTPVQSENLEGLRDTLGRLGWSLEPFGGNSWRIKTVPSWVDPPGAFDLLREILEECAQSSAGSWESLIERLLASMACHGAVRSGRRMELREALSLLKDMRRTPAKGLCPHGRPTVIEIPFAELQRRFGRT
jgi:DNA mismatch repair protein MutL